jgi:two-component system response regulator BaeR
MPYKILIVEDEIKLAELLKDYLQQSSMEIKIVTDGADVLSVLADYRPDVMLLDLMLPNKDGVSICREVRQLEAFNALAIIMTTAKIDEIDRLLGLEIGADDYICKPYSPREVVARVKAVLRRVKPLGKSSVEATVESSTYGFLFNDEKMKVYWHNKAIDLTAIEYALLKMMFITPGVIYSRSKLMDSMYSDYRVVSERTIDSHIKKLRQKLAQINDSIEVIHSVYGVGYKFECIEV